MKQIILLIVLFSAKFSYSQTTVKFPISVRGEIIGKGFFRPILSLKKIKRDYKNSYKARLEVTNNEDTILPIILMTCSWAESWSSDNDSIYILPPPVCLSNFPTIEEIPPGKSLVFYANVYVDPKVKNLSFRLGFSNYLKDFTKPENMIDIIEKKGKTYWSDIIQFEHSDSMEYFIQ